MEPTLFRMATTADLATRQRSRRRNQVIGGLVLIGLLAVATYFILANGSNKASRPDAGRQLNGSPRLAGDNGPPSALTAPPPPATLPITHPGSSVVPHTQRDDPHESHVPVVPSTLTAEQRKALAAKFTEAETKFAAKEILAARTLFNEVVDKGLPAEQNNLCVARLQSAADQLLFSPAKVPADPVSDRVTMPPSGRLSIIARTYKLRWQLLERINGVKAERVQAGQAIKVLNGPFHALVEKHAFTMSIYIDVPGPVGKPATPLLVRRFKVGLGEHDSTPTGGWTIKNMLPFPRYTHPQTNRVIEKDDPAYPFGKLGYWMALEGVDGNAIGQMRYGIHSTNDPASIGKMGSLGCIRMLDDDIKQVWELLVEVHSHVTVRD